jgi:hypothetical protein
MKKITVLGLMIATLLTFACEQQPYGYQPQQPAYESYSQYQSRMLAEQLAWDAAQSTYFYSHPGYTVRPYRRPTYNRYYVVTPRPVRSYGRVPATVVVRPTASSYPRYYARPTGTGLSPSRVVVRPTTTTYRSSSSSRRR